MARPNLVVLDRRAVTEAACLEARGVTLRYGAKTVLTNLTLAVRRREILSVIGPSGSGKTTLLRLLGGLVRPSQGSVHAGDEALTRPSRRLAFVFQDYGRALLPWRSVRGNIELALEARRMPRRDWPAIVDGLLEQVGLAHAAEAYPRQLSGGMQQRTQIARALAQEPEVLLMDEPFGALDAMTRQTLQDELLRLVRERGITAVFITHDLEEAIYLGDRVVSLAANPGRVADIVEVDLPFPRNQLNTREDGRFLALRHRLYGFLTDCR